MSIILGVTRRIVVIFKPENRRSHDAARLQIILNPRFKCAEIFTDDDGTGAFRLQRENAHHRRVVVVHVRPGAGISCFARCGAVYPPQAEESQDVVNPDTSGVAEDSAQQVTPWAIPCFG